MSDTEEAKRIRSIGRERGRETERKSDVERVDVPRVRITIDPATVKLDVAIYRP